jgi:hypothetical protein
MADARASVASIAAGTARQVWPLLALLTLLAAGGFVWWIRSGDPSLARLGGSLVLAGVGGLVGSFVVHETAHLLALRRLRTVTEVRLERTLWRLSLRPIGPMTPGQVAGVALAGPGACVVVGIALALALPESSVRWWYLAHAVFLLPVFGDGRALLGAVLALLSPRRP